MLLLKSFKLLDKFRGEVPYEKAKTFYIDTLGNVRKKLNKEVKSESTFRLHTIYLNYLNKEIQVIEGVQVYTRDGWKDVEKIKKGDKLIYFEAVIFDYGGTDLRMMFCDVESRQSKLVTEGLTFIDHQQAIVNGLLVREV